MNYNKQEILNIFQGFAFSDDFCEEDISRLDNYLLEMFDSFSFTIACGATKCVIIFNEKNYVIKIPFRGTCEGINYWPYECADSIKTSWDYCAVEVERYKKAKKYKLNSYLAKTIYIGTINNYPIYIQKKCITFDSVQNLFDKSCFSPFDKQKCLNIIEKYYQPYKINLYWLIDFMKCYGENQLISFLHFLSINEWDDDLRNENIGYINNYPVLIDYSGFWEV